MCGFCALAGPALPHLLYVILCGQMSRLCWPRAFSSAKLAPDYHYPDPKDALWLTVISSALHPTTDKPLPLPQGYFSWPRSASQVRHIRFYMVIQRVTSGASPLLSGRYAHLSDNSPHLSGADPKQIRRAMRRALPHPHRPPPKKDR